MRFLRVAVALENFSGKAAHGGVAAAFRNHRTAVTAIFHLRVELDIVQVCGQAQRAVEDFHLGDSGAVEETGGVQRLRVEVREDGVDELLKPTVLLGIGHRVDGKEHMELRPCRFAVLGLHVMAGVVNGKGHVRESLRHVRWIDPVLRVLSVVIVAIHRKAVTADEVVVAAVAVLVVGADVVALDGCGQGARVRYLVHMGIRAVGGVPDAVGMINMESHNVLLTGNTRAVTLRSKRACLTRRYAFSVATQSISHRQPLSLVLIALRFRICYLLQILCKIAQAVIFPLGSFDFCFHTR